MTRPDRARPRLPQVRALRGRRCASHRAGGEAGCARSCIADWTLAGDAKSLKRALKFKDFYRTMSFVNAVAHIANVEDHHPDLEVGYNYCRITYSTHSIGGLSQNDFICAAKIDRL